jgi:two-component system, NarL family, sensor histidine kinase BarA
MAERSSNRPTVETSLELKCSFMFGLAILVVFAVSSWLYWQVTEGVVAEQNPQTGRTLVDHVMLVTHLEVFNKDDREFAGFLESLDSELSEQRYESRLIRPSWSWHGVDDRPRDKFEQETLDAFILPPDTENEERDYRDRIVNKNGEELYQYYQAVRFLDTAETNCLSCHEQFAAATSSTAAPPMAEGDLIAVVQVSFANQAKDTSRWSWPLMLGVAVITAFLAFIAFYLVIRYIIIRPLRHLYEVSDEISRSGEIGERFELNTGDELEALADSFNRMLRRLTTIQDKLQTSNKSLETQYAEAARLNVQLHETNRIKSNFMATMSHELRTPLNSILGFSQVLATVDSLDDKQKRYVENINTSGRHLLEMINDILDLAKMEAGRFTVKLSEFPIRPLIGAQCDLAHPLFDRKQIELELNIGEGDDFMRSDESRLQQIVNNLLSNAIKFTPEGGRIQVLARHAAHPPSRFVHTRLHEEDHSSEFVEYDETDGWFVLEVIDSGVGISPEDQKIIFEKFRQGTTSLPEGTAETREHTGSGLGLSIVREICRWLGGEIVVRSELGTGSTFTVCLPWRVREAVEQVEPLPLDAEMRQFTNEWKKPTLSEGQELN